MAQTLDSQGNVVVNGLSTNLSPSQYAVNLPKTVSTSSLTPPTTNTAITQPSYDVNGYTNSSNSSQAYISSAQTQADTEAQNLRDSFAQENTGMGSLVNTLNGGGTNLKTSTINQVYNETGLNDKQAVLNRLSAESLGLGYAKDTIPLQLQNQVAGQGVTDRGLAPIQTAQLRNNAIQLASNAYQAAIAKADFDTAKAKADEMIAYKYDTTLAEINAKKTNLENIKMNLTSAEKKLADITTRRLDAEKKQAEQKMADEKDISNMITEAIPNAPTSVTANAKKLAESGASKLAVAQALGVYGGNYLANELLKEQIKNAQSSRALAQQKAEGTNISGKPLKVSNTEITNLNETLTARDSVTALVNQFKQNIKDYGTQTVFGTAAGDREALRTNLLLAIKNMEKTGALDAGTISVLEGTIPSSKFFATQEAQTAALNTLLNTIDTKTNSYINSYKGTSAETDPRTKRAYEEVKLVSSGNQQADEYAKLTMQSLNNVNTSLSTPNAMSAGFVDNQE